MHLRSLLWACVAGALVAGCGREDKTTTDAASAPYVRTVALAPAAADRLVLSGIVRARFETPLAFQVGGRITSRRADAGQRVDAGQTLFELDPRDLQQGVEAARADVAAAESALATARADLARARQLFEQKFVSAQALDRSVLAEREAATRLEAARARLAQARNGLAYAQLRAPAAGVLTEVTGEPGQVVPAGQPVAVLAREGEREIEAYFPEQIRPPTSGRLLDAPGTLRLREVSGAVDPQSRTWRARYRVEGAQAPLALGAVLRVAFGTGEASDSSLSVPLSALDERGQGPRLWRIVNGQAQPVPVTILSMDTEQARVRGDFKPGDRVIALGTHLLTPGMAVRELAQ
ncbi:efflux RND transporter periplasmic adaptor subunit [Thiobacter aerophilum]|uniref:Efflux RND transporter periplasmic adaptor subunit n=1 Tax=Thiobacter aerophilum TaxID=3121275 RepID=A0ABV0EC84_9BURK